MFGSQSAKRSVVLLRHKLWLLCKYVIAWWLILQHKYWKEHFFSWQGILHLGFLVIKTAFLFLQLWDVLLVDVAFVTVVLFSLGISTESNDVSIRKRKRGECFKHWYKRTVSFLLLLLTFGYLCHNQAMTTCKYW